MLGLRIHLTYGLTSENPFDVALSVRYLTPTWATGAAAIGVETIHLAGGADEKPFVVAMSRGSRELGLTNLRGA